MEEPYKLLANAVVLQSVKDWRAAVKKLRKYPDHRESQRTKKECEEFFLSGWFEELTSVDGGFILKKLKQEENIQ